MMRPPVKITKRSPRPPARPQSARPHRDALDYLLEFESEPDVSPIRRSKSRTAEAAGLPLLPASGPIHGSGFRGLIVGKGSSLPTVAAVPERISEHNQDNAKLDNFEESLDEYIELIRIEGRKALSLAKCQLNAALALNYEAELGDLKILVAERDESIATLSREIEARKEVTTRQSRQLLALAGLVCSKRQRESFTLPQSHSEVVKSVLSWWMRNAQERKRDREGSFVYTIMYECKLSLKVWSAWRLTAVTGSMARSSAEQLAILEKEKDAVIVALSEQRSEAITALEETKRELELERVKRSEVLLKIKSLFAHKFEDISSEVDHIGDSAKVSPKAVFLPTVTITPAPNKKTIRH